MLIRQHERFVEELNVQMSFKQPTTSSGAIMTLPAATADLRDWVADQREFSSVQRDDWMQVIDDFRDSLAETGPKLSRHVEAVTSQIESQWPKLISPSAPDPVPSPIASLLRKIAPSGGSAASRKRPHRSLAEVRLKPRVSGDRAGSADVRGRRVSGVGFCVGVR